MARGSDSVVVGQGLWAKGRRARFAPGVPPFGTRSFSSLATRPCSPGFQLGAPGLPEQPTQPKHQDMAEADRSSEQAGAEIKLLPDENDGTEYQKENDDDNPEY